MEKLYEDLLKSLYASLTKDPPWVMFLNFLSTTLNANSCTLVMRKPTHNDLGVFYSDNTNHNALEILPDIIDHSPFNNVNNDEMYILRDMMSEKELIEKHPAYHAYIKSMNTMDLIALNLEDEDTGMNFKFRFSREPKDGAFTLQDREFIKTLIPHLKIATSIYANFCHQNQRIHVSEELFSQLGIATFILDENDQVLLLNSAAESLLKSTNDFVLTNGRLRNNSNTYDHQLRDCLQDIKKLAHSKFDNIYRILIPKKHNPEESWSLLVKKTELPIETRNVRSITTSVLIRSLSSHPLISTDQLVEIFSFTPAEAQLIERLVHGDTVTEAAKQLGRSVSTARAQLAACFSKTDIHKQHQLISHVLHTLNNLWVEIKTPQE